MHVGSGFRTGNGGNWTLMQDIASRCNLRGPALVAPRRCWHRTNAMFSVVGNLIPPSRSPIRRLTVLYEQQPKNESAGVTLLPELPRLAAGDEGVFGAGGADRAEHKDQDEPPGWRCRVVEPVPLLGVAPVLGWRDP
jgi:hypothetical protein